MRNDKGQFIKGFPHNKGVKRDDAFREMRRKMQTGKKLSKKTRKKMSESAKGKIRSKEHCKNLSEAKKGSKNGMYGKKWSEYTRRLQSKIHGGPNSHFWKGGIHPINNKIRQSLNYRIWREKILKRDDYTCVWCRKRGGKLHVDHIKPFSTHPKLRFKIGNGRTLCIPCHNIRHSRVYDAVKRREDFRINLFKK